MPDPHAPAIPLLVSTRNAHKIAEIRAILGAAFAVCDLSAIPEMPDVEESGETFEENATLKAMAASVRFSGWVIADDSGFEVDALGGDPGVRSARYAGEPASDPANNALLLKNLETASSRTARFRCVIVLVRTGQKQAVFTGAVEGTIISSPRGAAGFGYDPLFVPDGHEETLAELGAEVKNGLSHRARALAGLRAWAEGNGVVG